MAKGGIETLAQVRLFQDLRKAHLRRSVVAADNVRRHAELSPRTEAVCWALWNARRGLFGDLGVAQARTTVCVRLGVRACLNLGYTETGNALACKRVSYDW